MCTQRFFLGMFSDVLAVGFFRGVAMPLAMKKGQLCLFSVEIPCNSPCIFKKLLGASDCICNVVVKLSVQVVKFQLATHTSRGQNEHASGRLSFCLVVVRLYLLV